MSYQIGSLKTVVPRTDEPLTQDQVLETKGIPWLLANPQAVHQIWQGRMKAVLEHVRTAKINCSRWSQAKGLPKVTQHRLKALGEAEQARIALLEKICEQLNFNKDSKAPDSNMTATEQGILNYFDHITRDWAWGEKEIDEQIHLIQKIHPKSETEKATVVVVGSGAGRLVYELRRQKVFKEVIALDINPLLLTLSKNIAEGQTLSIPEFPVGPKSNEVSTLVHKCKAPEKVTDLHFALADAYDLPFANESLDYVLTPFLIDILPLHFEYLIQEINRVLKTNGKWMSIGTVGFHRGDARIQLVKDEVREALNYHGFKSKSEAEAVMTFVSSPNSRQTRTELLDAWTFEKTADAKPVREAVDEIGQPEVGAAVANINMSEKIGVTPAIQQKLVEAEVHYWVLSQIDGTTSVKDIIDRLVQTANLPYPAAEDAVVSYLSKNVLKK